MSLRSGPAFALSACCLLACSPKAKTNVTSDPAGAELGRAPGVASPEHEGQPPERMTFRVAVHELDDMIVATERLVDNWDPPGPGEPGLDIMTMAADAALQAGLAPGVLEALDLTGLHTFEFDTPYERYGHLPPDNFDVRVTLATHDPKRIVSSMPGELQPEEIGTNRWRLADDEVELLLQADQGVLGAGTGPEQLDAALAYRNERVQQAAGPRVHLEVLNPDPDELDLYELLGELPGLDEQTLDRLASDATFDMSVDFGTQRDFTARFGVLAPFDDKASKASAIEGPTALATILPPDPLVVVQQTWGPLTQDVVHDLGPLLDELDAPEELRAMFGAGATLASLGDELIFTAYFDSKGRATFVLAVEITDAKTVQTKIRDWQQSAVVTALDKGLQASFKPDALRLGSLEADLLTVDFGKDLADAAKRNRWLFRDGKPKAEIAALVTDNAMVVTTGAGQREVLRAIAKRADKPSGDNIDNHGLSLARSLTEGCHTCVAADLPGLLDAFLVVVEGVPKANPETLRSAKALHAKLRAMKLTGDVAFAGRYDADGWHLGIGIANALLFANATELLELGDQLEDFVDALTGAATPTKREVCEHVMDIAKSEAGPGATLPSDEDIARATDKCVEDLGAEREKLGADIYEEMVECVMDEDSLEGVMRCDRD